MRIDAHQHFWRYDARRDTWIGDHMSVLKRDFLPADLAPELAANGIEASIAVQADQSEAETLFLLELANADPTIAGVVGWVDLRSANVEERLHFFSRFEKLCGFRHVVQSEPDDDFLLQPDFVRGLRALAQFHFTYDLLIYPRQLPAAIRLVEQLPDQHFVLDHIAKPPIGRGVLSPWRENIHELAAAQNVDCKLSGLVTEADWRQWSASDFRPYLDVVFEAFGPRRLMFGSDWPVCLLAASYSQVTALVSDYVREVAPNEVTAVFGANALRCYGMKAAEWTCTSRTASSS
jgi:L-fuconolactonase